MSFRVTYSAIQPTEMSNEMKCKHFKYCIIQSKVIFKRTLLNS